MPPPAPQSAARLPSLARYGVRAVERCIETQGLMAKPCTPQPIAQRVQLFKCQSRNVSLSLGDIKGVFSFAKENTPFAPCSAIGAALPHPWQGKRKSTTTFVVMLYGAGDEARSRHYRAATRTAGDKRPTGAFSRFARALFAPLPAGAKK